MIQVTFLKTPDLLNFSLLSGAAKAALLDGGRLEVWALVVVGSRDPSIPASRKDRAMTHPRAIKYVCALCVSFVSLSASAEYDLRLDEEELDFLIRINEYRESIGAPCLTPSPTMNAAADYMSRFMGEEGFFDHNEPPCDDAGDICNGRDPFDRIEAFGHTQWRTSAENIAAGNSDGASTFDQWKNSPGHDRNMRNADFTSIGIGRVEVPGSYYRYYWTTNFSDWVDGNGDCTRDDPSDYPDLNEESASDSGDADPSDEATETDQNEASNEVGGAENEQAGDGSEEGGCTNSSQADVLSLSLLLGGLAFVRRRSLTCARLT